MTTGGVEATLAGEEKRCGTHSRWLVALNVLGDEIVLLFPILRGGFMTIISISFLKNGL